MATMLHANSCLIFCALLLGLLASNQVSLAQEGRQEFSHPERLGTENRAHFAKLAAIHN